MLKAGKFILFSREEFGEWLMKQTVKRKISTIQNHHTYKPDYRDFNGKNHFDLAKSMERYHIRTAKMSEIAQNFTTYNDGTIMLCRSLDKDPAGFKGAANNRGAITIEHVGNFDHKHDQMTEEHKKTIVFLNAILSIRFSIIPSTQTILYHHFVSQKTCPGTNFFGGNTKAAAEKYFIPLIKNSVDTIRNQNNSLPDKADAPQKLSLGSKGEPVVKLQTILRSLGYKLQADGVFGTNTDESVKEFQKTVGLNADGIVGEKTWAKLDSIKM